MKNRRYFILTLLMVMIVTPIILSISVLIGVVASSAIVALAFAPLTLLAWYFYLKHVNAPDTWGARLAPITAAYAYFVGTWVITMLISQCSYDGQVWNTFGVMTLLYFLLNGFSIFIGNFAPFVWVQFIITVSIIALMVFTWRKRKALFGKGFIIAVGTMTALTFIAGLQVVIRSQTLLTDYTDTPRVYDEINLYQYRPFAAHNLLQTLSDEPELRIADHYPRLDGATAAYPVYGAMVQAIYTGLDKNTVADYVQCNTTNEAYRRLIDGEIDVFFGTQPSAEQLAVAKEKGLAFELLPIAKEAFVFFVNTKNPVDTLTITEIQDIYTKQITSWHTVGGNKEKIMPFQRSENSGSQTIMQYKVMQGIELPAPLREEYAAGMGGVINDVATYRNYTSAIGYTFRFYAQGMKPNENIKLLAINGIAPTIENIQSGAYPFTVDVYAVTIGEKSPNTQRLLDWITSAQGQGFIEQCGYVAR